MSYSVAKLYHDQNVLGYILVNDTVNKPASMILFNTEQAAWASKGTTPDVARCSCKTDLYRLSLDVDAGLEVNVCTRCRVIESCF